MLLPSWTPMNYSFMHCDLNNRLKVRYSGHGLNNGIVKLRNLNDTVIQMSGIPIATVQAAKTLKCQSFVLKIFIEVV